MFTDERRHKIWSELGQYGLRCFREILSPDVFAEAADRAAIRVIKSPLSVVNLAWLGIAAALHCTRSFAEVLVVTWTILEDAQFSDPQSKPLRKAAKRGTKSKSRKKAHDPRGANGAQVTEEAFAQARKRMPLQFWAALLMVLVERFQLRHRKLTRWKGFRLLAIDGTEITLPGHPLLKAYYGLARGKRGTARRPQARMVMLQFPLVRFPYRYLLAPRKTAEITLAEQLMSHVEINDLLLLDRGFWSYWLLADIIQRQAYFGIRLKSGSRLTTLRSLGRGDRLVKWTPHPTKLRKWKQQGREVPPSLTLRVIDYQVPGFRPSGVVTNVLDPAQASREDWVRLTTESDAGRRLLPGLYHHRWEIETTFRELKVSQQWHRDHWLRSRTPPSIEYEIAGHVIFYLLVRWLMVDAAVEAGVDPLRLSFLKTLRAIGDALPGLITATPQYVGQVLLPRLRQKVACFVVPLRPGRHYPRPGDTKPKCKGRNRWQLPAKTRATKT
jgi:hypothetical protein